MLSVAVFSRATLFISVFIPSLKYIHQDSSWAWVQKAVSRNQEIKQCQPNSRLQQRLLSIFHLIPGWPGPQKINSCLFEVSLLMELGQLTSVCLKFWKPNPPPRVCQIRHIFFLIEVELIYNVVPISAVQQSDSVLHIYILFLIFFSIMVYLRRLDIVPCAIQ